MSEKLLDDLRNLKLGFEYQAKVAGENIAHNTKMEDHRGVMFEHGKKEAWEKAIEGLNQVIEAAEKRGKNNVK